jgi:glycosyltransferase involved in cell wall biosynthesis
MKILICSEFFKPNVGGVEIHSEVLANYLSKNHKVNVATTFLNRTSKELKKKIAINEFKIKGSLVKGYSGEIKNYENFLLNSDFDIIFFNAAQQWTFDLALPILHKIKSKKIFFPCGFSRLNNIFFKPYFEILKIKLKYFDEIICCSKNWKDYKFCKKYFKKKINIISNGSFSLKNKKQKKNLAIKYVSVSNLKYLKGQDRIIDIFKNLNHSAILKIYYSNYSILFKIYLFLKIAIFNKLNKNKKIYLIHERKRIDMSEVLSGANSFIFGSRLEYNPLVVFESMAAGIPFVSFDVGIIKEIINKDVLGFVSNDKLKISKYLNNLNSSNYNKYKIIKNFEKKFNWKEILKKYNRIFKKYERK